MGKPPRQSPGTILDLVAANWQLPNVMSSTMDAISIDPLFSKFRSQLWLGRTRADRGEASAAQECHNPGASETDPHNTAVAQAWHELHYGFDLLVSLGPLPCFHATSTFDSNCLARLVRFGSKDIHTVAKLTLP
ncbi:hypothetical protein NCS52_01050400 [Fusarium sp. LHS14.1]|nr:hypothetical protein NCS52_01050400 [Fusarium sp. LHS14.1]